MYVELGVQQKDMYALSMNEAPVTTAGAGGIPMGSYTGVYVTKEAQIHCLYARPFPFYTFGSRACRWKDDRGSGRRGVSIAGCVRRGLAFIPAVHFHEM